MALFYPLRPLCQVAVAPAHKPGATGHTSGPRSYRATTPRRHTTAVRAGAARFSPAGGPDWADRTCSSKSEGSTMAPAPASPPHQTVTRTATPFQRVT